MLHQLLAAKQPKTGIKSGRRRPEDKINYLLQNSDKDPNLAVLRNYFHKIKSVNQAVDHNHTSTRPNGKKYNANAGFGPIVSQTENKKQMIRRKRPRSRRKIFLTVNEAFSRSEFNGREMRDLHKNYLMYVPIKASNKVQTLDNKQVLLQIWNTLFEISECKIAFTAFSTMPKSHLQKHFNNEAAVKGTNVYCRGKAHDEIFPTHE